MSVPLEEQLGDTLIAVRQKLASLEAENDRLRSNIIALFKRGKADGNRCKYCDAPVYYLVHQDSGKKGVYDPDGTSHWATCSKAAQVRRDQDARKSAQGMK